MTLYIHPDSRKILEATLSQEPHAVLLSGPVGVGLATIAKFYASSPHFAIKNRRNPQIVEVLPEKDEKIDLEKGVITIQSIRRLYDMTRTIEPSGRVVIIDYAERMAVPAQNAFLKLLEEPLEGTHFILLTHQPELLLPTITSRTQRVDVRKVTSEQSLQLLSELGATQPNKVSQLMFIAEGLPAEIHRLVGDDQYFERRASLVRDARDYITGSAYRKMLIAKKYKDDRQDALTLLEDSMKLLRRTIAENGDESALRRVARLEILHRRVFEQGGVRLQLSAGIVL